MYKFMNSHASIIAEKGNVARLKNDKKNFPVKMLKITLLWCLFFLKSMMFVLLKYLKFFYFKKKGSCHCIVWSDHYCRIGSANMLVPQDWLSKNVCASFCGSVELFFVKTISKILVILTYLKFVLLLKKKKRERERSCH